MLLLLLSSFIILSLSTDYTPQQIHINQGDFYGNSMTISWITSNNTNEVAQVWYGNSKRYLTLSEYSSVLPYTYSFTSLYENYMSGYINNVVINKLYSDTTYYYQCGSSKAKSKILSFTTPPQASPETPITLGFVGDLGQTVDSVDTIQALALHTDVDMSLIIGDLSYADSGDNPATWGENCTQRRWDSYGQIMQFYAAENIIMTCPGNHEVEKALNQPEFLAYASRYHMPYEASYSDSPLYYSFEVSGAHIIMLNSYSDFSTSSPQYAFFVKDLSRVDRSRTPWLIVSMHAPWYNSNSHHQGEFEEWAMRDIYEPLVIQYSVDIVFAGHVHSYERSYNVAYNKTVDGAPTYINIGDGGNREGLALPWLQQPSWSAYRQASYGFGKLEIQNSTHAYWAWYLNNGSNRDPIDQLTFVRNSDKVGLKAHARY